MYVAILGDIVGAPYEYDMSEKIKNFPLWIESSRKTDDTAMTLAVAEALLNARYKSNDKIKEALIKSMKNMEIFILGKGMEQDSHSGLILLTANHMEVLIIVQL